MLVNCLILRRWLTNMILIVISSPFLIKTLIIVMLASECTWSIKWKYLDNEDI